MLLLTTPACSVVQIIEQRSWACRAGRRVPGRRRRLLESTFGEVVALQRVPYVAYGHIVATSIVMRPITMHQCTAQAGKQRPHRHFTSSAIPHATWVIPLSDSVLAIQLAASPHRPQGCRYLSTNPQLIKVPTYQRGNDQTIAVPECRVPHLDTPFRARRAIQWCACGLY